VKGVILANKNKHFLHLVKQIAWLISKAVSIFKKGCTGHLYGAFFYPSLLKILYLGALNSHKLLIIALDLWLYGEFNPLKNAHCFRFQAFLQVSSF